MEEKLKLHLDKDEKLVWFSKPANYETMDAVYKPAFVKSCIIGAAVFAVLSILYFLALGKYSAGIKAWLFIIFALAGAFKPFSYITDASKLRKTVYAVTDKRLLIIGNDTRALELSALKSAAIKTDEAGNSSLLCGENSINLKPTKWREATCFARFDSAQEEESRYAFYAVEDVEGLKAALAPYVNL